MRAHDLLGPLLLLIVDTAHAGLHPEVILRDADRRAVLESGAPVSTMQTCGTCHDTAWIEAHSPHAWLGLDELAPGRSGRAFDSGPGTLRRFDPISYVHVSFDPTAFTLGVADWLRREGDRHVGGGLATKTHDGRDLRALDPANEDDRVYTHGRGGEDAPMAWNWEQSGVAELNCFLCHLAEPADAARREALGTGRFGWAATATLEHTGLVERDGDIWRYRAGRFTPEGAVTRDMLGLRPPTDANCGSCHGAVIARPDTPFWLGPGRTHARTLRTGEIFAPGRIVRSGMNVRDREQLTRAWDVHAERLVGCTSCHPTANDPSHFDERSADQPRHLRYQARKLERSEYLLRPDHSFAQGRTASGTMRDDLDGSMRGCTDCHDASAAHAWLPYRERHFERLACESCHVPSSFAPALRAIDWTVLDAQAQPRREYRGALEDPFDPLTLVDGYRPVLLPRVTSDGTTRFAPHNLVSAWYWIDAHDGRPVSREVLEAAWFEHGSVHPSILDALDATGNGVIDPTELGLSEGHQVQAVRARLIESGVRDPQIRAEIQPFGLHHGIASGAWATRDCTACHGTGSLLAAAFTLSTLAPDGVMPEFVIDAGLAATGAVTRSAGGQIVYEPDPRIAGLYLFGFERARWVDAVGLLALVLVLAGVALHGGLRLVLAAARRAREEEERRATLPAQPETEVA
jgi:hypothetical protein